MWNVERRLSIHHHSHRQPQSRRVGYTLACVYLATYVHFACTVTRSRSLCCFLYRAGRKRGVGVWLPHVCFFLSLSCFWGRVAVMVRGYCVGLDWIGSGLPTIERDAYDSGNPCYSSCVRKCNPA
ncbi:hypothetical protein T440DRAFT_100255 [Plenodomus tracheiphilus IPT5]|uniref:Uncharacterized protein n=1 Tax=Plenodomus tracheiphilus IPT5 TaxID=1408161 RepID=A0A6A7BL73_9PLEO|nr:hypothetical protein T440DRAFT_100255 [Plenodomus tracheiphilus IPT5]